MVTAEVQDETHQTIAANVAIPAHQARRLLRHRPRQPDRRRATARGRSRSSPSIRKGTAIAASGTFKVIKRDWNCAWEAWGYRGSYRCEKKETR